MGEIGSGTGSSYSTALDTDAVPEVDNDTTARANVPNDLADAVVAIETYVGVAGDNTNIVKTTGLSTIVAGATGGLIVDQNNNGISLKLDSEATSAAALTIEALNTSGSVIDIDKTGANPGVVLDILNAGTGNLLFANQDGNGVAINVDSEATNANTVTIDDVTTGNTINILHGGASGNVVDIENDGTGTTLVVDSDANGISVDINSAATSADAVNLDAVHTSGIVLDVNLTPGAASTAVILDLTNSGANASTGNILNINNSANGCCLNIEKTGAGAGIVADIENDGTGDAVFINQDGNGIAIDIDTESTSADTINIDAVNTSGSVVDINVVPGGASTAIALDVASATSTGDLVFLNQDGNGKSLNIDSEATSATVFNIDAENSSGNIVVIDTNKFVIDYTGAITQTALYASMGTAVKTSDLYAAANDYWLEMGGSGATTKSRIWNRPESLQMQISSNAYYKGTTSQWTADNAGEACTRLAIGATTAGTDAFVFSHNSTSGAAPITWDDLIKIKDTGELFIDQDNNNNAINIDSEATSADVINIESANTSGNVFDVNTTAIAGGTVLDIDGGGLTTGVGIALGIASSSFGSLTTGTMLQGWTGSKAITSGRFFYFENYLTTTELSGKTTNYGLMNVYREEQRTSGTTTDDYDVLAISRSDRQNGAGGTHASLGSCLRLSVGSTQTAGTLTNDAVALEIAQVTYSASDVYAIKITSDNDGAGAPGGIDVSTFAASEPIFKVPTDNTPITTTLTDSTGRIAIKDAAGNVRYIPYFS